MAVVRKKQDDKNLKILRELVSLGGNKQCFDCNQKGPTYVNMTIGSFVCTRCSGVLRGLTPIDGKPHRVKSISMATFTAEEIEFIKAHGNELCAKTWLGLWDPKRVHTQDQRELMIDKYERKRFYLEPASPLKSITNTAQLAPSQKQQQQQQQQTQLNSATLLTNGTAKSIEENNSNLWASNATLNGKNQNTPSTNRWKMDLLSSNDNNSLFSNHISAPIATNGIRSNGTSTHGTPTNGFTSNGGDTPKNAINKNGFHLPPPASKVDNTNSFTPDTEFVADFSTANIFDALNNKPSINNNASTNKPILLNGNHSNRVDLTNGNQTNGNNHNGHYATTDVNKNFDENFADFDHNPIYNAAAIENQNSNYFSSFGYNNNSAHSNNGNANTQWSVWQQFPWPYIQPEQNRWSLPMSLSSTSNSLKSSGTFNSNSSINSTPSVDRYAALKDLDEQLREIKEKDNQNTLSAAAAPTANPFNVITNPSTASVQPNPFQATSSPHWFNEQPSLTPANQTIYPMTNGNGNGIYDQNSFGLNGSAFNGNGSHYPKVTDSNMFNGSLNMANGFPQKNPFAAPVLNATTNPFL